MRRIGPVDTIWLNMDRPNNLMVIDSLTFLDEPVGWDRLQAVLRERLLGRFPVFRQRPVEPTVPWGLPHWEDDPEFALERHVRRVRLPAPGDDEALRRYVEGHLGRPLDRSRPLWEATLIEGYGSGAVIFCRFHHAISDGIALTHVLMSLTDASPDPEREAGTNAADTAGTRPAGLLGSAVRAVSAARGLAGSVISDASSLVTGLPRWAGPAGVGDALVQGWRGVGVLNKLLLDGNPATSLGGQPGVDKTVVWSRPLPLADVKHAGRLAGATVNDVLVSALAGAIWTYLVDHDGAATDLTTMVPVNLRPLDGTLPSELGNRFALVLLKLPSGVSAPLARLAETKRRMDTIKHSPESAMAFGLITAIGRTVKDVERVLVDFFAGKAIGVTTNVAGPSAPRYLAGAKIAGMLAWAPSSGRQTLTVCIVTYNDTVRVGFKVDAEVVRDPEKLVGAFEAHVDTLTCMARAA
jgi:diacylglycerol O-acyltransferase / wax synthase